MARKRSRTKSGRFTKARTRSTRGRRYSVKTRRRNPQRTGSYSPKRGQRRLAAPSRRRAYSRRRNQAGFMNSPAVRYSLAASAGFFAAAFADSAEWLNPKKADGTPVLPMGIRGSLVGAVALGVIATYATTGRNKQYLYAAAVGMAAPTAIGLVNTMLPGGAMHNNQAWPSVGGSSSTGITRPLSLPRNNPHTQSAARFVRASNALDNQVA